MHDGSGNPDPVIRMLYDQHAGSLLTFALRLTDGDRRRAEDVVRETLARAWHEVHRSGRPAGLLRPWLMTVARRIATGGPGARPAPIDPAPRALPGPPDDTDGAVSGALRDLPPADREILIETYFRGRTVAEAAAKLNLPVDTAKSRTFHALRALRTALEQRHS